MRFHAVIFDLDGTLLDSLEDIANSANSVLEKHNFPTHDIDEYRNFIGDGVDLLITRALPAEERNDDTIIECVKAYRKAYSRNWNVNSRPYDGVTEMLDELAARQIKLAVLSNKPDDFTKKCVTEFLQNCSFDAILGHHKGIFHKPDPTGAIQITGKLGIPPEQILFVGDSAVDMKTAIAAGMFPVGVLWGFNSYRELQDSGAKVLIKHPRELAQHLKSSMHDIGD